MKKILLLFLLCFNVLAFGNIENYIDYNKIEEAGFSYMTEVGGDSVFIKKLKNEFYTLGMQYIDRGVGRNVFEGLVKKKEEVLNPYFNEEVFYKTNDLLITKRINKDKKNRKEYTMIYFPNYQKEVIFSLTLVRKGKLPTLKSGEIKKIKEMLDGFLLN